MPPVQAWVRHVGTPFRPALAVFQSDEDARCLSAGAWGAPMAQSSLRYVADSCVSLGARVVLTVPMAVYASALWAWRRPHAAWAWLLVAPACGVVGGAALLSAGLLCDASRIGVMTALAAGNYVYALAQSAADALQDSWVGRERAPDVFALDRAATARVQARAQAQAQAQVQDAPGAQSVGGQP